MCIRDRDSPVQLSARIALRDVDVAGTRVLRGELVMLYLACLLYTSDAADDLLCVDLGGRRIIKKKKQSALCNARRGS